GNDYVFQGATAQSPGQAFDRAQIVQAEMEILDSKALRDGAIKAIGLQRMYPALARSPQGMGEADQALSRDLTITNVPESNVIELSLRNRDPQVAADALNKLVALYVERRREVFEQQDLASVSAQETQLNQQLADAEKAVTNFSSANGFGDYNQEFTAVQAEQNQLTSELQATDAQLAARTASVGQLRRRIAQTPSEMQLSVDSGRSQQLQTMTDTLLSLQNQRREAAAKYTDGYPLVTDLDQRIAQLQSQIAAAPAQQQMATRRGVNPVRQQLDTTLADGEDDAAGLRASRAAIAKSLQSVDARLNELLTLGPRYRELVKTRDLAQDAAAGLAKQLEDTQLTDIMSHSRANVRVIQAAEPPTTGKSGRMILLAAGVGAGLLAALATIILSIAFSEVMVGPADVEQKLGLPILLAVPDAKRGARRASLKPLHLTAEDSHLLMRLLASVPADGGRVLQLVSAHEGEGVSSLMQDIAFTEAAQSARRVLLVDVEPRPGREIAQNLAKQGVAMRREPGDKLMQVADTALFVSFPIRAADLADGRMDWRKVLGKARDRFDLILVDAPPLQRSAAALAIAPYADITLAVVEAEKTRAAVARNLVDRVETAGGEVLGVVLNKRRFYIPRLLYQWL
ncbi:MAG: hypothetical protein JO303_15540, partial [Caulobacteraceae bacterium]|nr:hypothetical protein [Caulobacteraceae bacterium]